MENLLPIICILSRLRQVSSYATNPQTQGGWVELRSRMMKSEQKDAKVAKEARYAMRSLRPSV